MKSDGTFSTPRAASAFACAQPSCLEAEATQLRHAFKALGHQLSKDDPASTHKSLLEMEKTTQTAAAYLQKHVANLPKSMNALFKPTPGAPRDPYAFGAGYGVVRLAADLAFHQKPQVRNASLVQLDKRILQEAGQTYPELAVVMGYILGYQQKRARRASDHDWPCEGRADDEKLLCDGAFGIGLRARGIFGWGDCCSPAGRRKYGNDCIALATAASVLFAGERYLPEPRFPTTRRTRLRKIKHHLARWLKHRPALDTPQTTEKIVRLGPEGILQTVKRLNDDHGSLSENIGIIRRSMLQLSISAFESVMGDIAAEAGAWKHVVMREHLAGILYAVAAERWGSGAQPKTRDRGLKTLAHTIDRLDVDEGAHGLTPTFNHILRESTREGADKALIVRRLQGAVATHRVYPYCHILTSMGIQVGPASYRRI